MSEDFVLQVARDAMVTVLMVGGPILGLSLLTGLAVSLFQATTQINEQTLTFIPKIFAVLIAIMVFGPWMLTVMVNFTANLFGYLPGVAGQ